MARNVPRGLHLAPISSNMLRWDPIGYNLGVRYHLECVAWDVDEYGELRQMNGTWAISNALL